MALSFVDLFDSRVAEGLASCGVDLSSPLTLGAAVSGGADSVSLVTALSHVLPPSARLLAVTVNHNLREEAETAGDADFV
ncbi:MAG: tRNA(Ile)-lysidine synthetase, partial [Treponema sp.]|nr:tRNA(Ile)-lysidine synthetase [Treponema sp.]